MVQILAEPDDDDDDDEDEVEDVAEDETEAVTDEDGVAIASSSVELASNARPGIGQPEGTSKPEVGLLGQTILSPSMIGVPQQ